MGKLLFKIIILLFFLLNIKCFAIDEIKINFDNNKRRSTTHELGDVLPIFKYTIPEDGKFTYGKIDLRIFLPDMKNCTDTAFGKEYFTGWGGPPFERQFFFIVGNYKQDTTYIWLDKNFNLDLRDDGEPLLLSKHKPELYISLHNSENSNAKFVYKFTKANLEDTIRRNEIKEFHYNDDPEKGFITTDIDYWLATHRYNMIGKDTVLNGDSVCIGIMDWNCNGTFNDMDTVSKNHFHSDRVCFGMYGDQNLSSFTWDGAIEYLPETIIKIGDRTYEVTGIEESGKFISFKPTDKHFNRIRNGDPCPDFEYVLFDSAKTTLYSQLEMGKYNIVYIWANWCHGCNLEIPILNNYDSLYSDLLNIVGLHNWQGYGDGTPAWIKKHGIEWTKGVSSPGICEKLLTGGAGGFMILLDKDLKIIKLAFNLRDIENYIKI